MDKRFLDKNLVNKLKKRSIKIIARSVFLQGLFFKKKEFIFNRFNNIKKKYLELSNIAKKENLTLGQLALIWSLSIKEIDYITFGVDNKSFRSNIKLLTKKISKNSLLQINNIKLENHKIIKPYLWKKNIVAIIQARLTSKRFPNKVIQKIGNKYLINMLLERVKKSKKLTKRSWQYQITKKIL